MPSSTPWYALSVRQPYAELILRGIKRFEARTWVPAERGDIVIHASQAFATGWKRDPAVLKALRKARMTTEDVLALPRSALIGLVQVVGAIDAYDPRQHKLPLFQRELCADEGDTDDFFLWRLSDPERIRPRPCDGKLGLWPVPPRYARWLNSRFT